MQTKRRLSVSGRSAMGVLSMMEARSMQTSEDAAITGAEAEASAGRDEGQKMCEEMQVHMQALQKQVTFLAQSVDGMEKIWSSYMITILPMEQDGEEYSPSEFRAEFNALMESELCQNYFSESTIISIQDIKPKEFQLVMFQASRAHELMQKLITVAKQQRLALKFMHYGTVGAKNIKRLARDIYRCIATTLEAVQLDPQQHVLSKLPRRAAAPNFEHRITDWSGTETIWVKGELMQHETGYKYFLVSLRSKVIFEGEAWDLAELAKDIKEVVESIKGYPYLLDTEVGDGDLAPMKTFTVGEESPTNGEGTAQQSGKGKSRGKGKGQKAGKGGRSRGKGGKGSRQ